MIVTIHQPEHAVWLGLLDKISKCDVFVILDTVDFRKNYFQNRNQVRSKTEKVWLTVPVEKDNHKPINQVLIAKDESWKRKYLKTLELNYGKAPYFSQYFPIISEIINCNITKICDLNCTLLSMFKDWFKLYPKVVYASDLRLDPSLKSSDLILAICKKLKATKYLSGAFGVDYLDQKAFADAGIEIEFHKFFHAVYQQTYDNFICGLSAYDALFNYGPDVRYLLNNKGTEPLRRVLQKIDFYTNSSVLEMFGGDGSGHLRAYGRAIDDLEIWELNSDNCWDLRYYYPNAVVKNVDSLQELKTCDRKFDVIIIDPPVGMEYENIFPEVINLMNSTGYIIMRSIKKLYAPNDKLQVTDFSFYRSDILTKCAILDIYEVEREYYFTDLWLTDIVIKIQKYD